MSSEALVYRFADFELDTGRFELRERGEAKHLEPQVLSLLIQLAGNADRLVSKDELIEKVWGGRFISDAAVASRVKAARQVLGDDGKRQDIIRTVHGKGFRFAAQVTFALPQAPVAATVEEAAAAVPMPERPSIAVLPFRAARGAAPLAAMANALADDLITELSRLRWLLVIARASTFRFRDRAVASDEIGAALHVRYCFTGVMEPVGSGIALSVELARTADNAIVWSERYVAGRDELPHLRQEILAGLVGNLEARIVQQEVELARRTPEPALDAWSAFHLGLDSMFRFSKSDNARAAALFERSAVLDPHFSRAYSGLSFTSFQDAFLQYSGQPDEPAQRAHGYAERALQLDPHDPFAHLNLGRSLWLAGAVADSIETLSASIALSPNFVQAIYSKAWAEMTQCDVARSNENAALALRLSPLDPLRYAMLGVRSVNALMAGEMETALDLGEKAARSPGAHKHIAVIAALAAHASGRSERATRWVERARQLDPSVTRATFLRSFPFAQSAGRETIEQTLREVGL